FWSASFVAFNGDMVQELAVQYLSLAEKQGSPVPLMVGHRLKGMALLHTGEIAGGRAHLDCKFACNSDPLRGDFRVQFRPLLIFCVSVLPFGPDGPGGTVGDGWRGQDRPGTTR